MNKNERRKWRLEQAEQLVASSLSVKEWCKLNHVAESTMHAWLKAYREQAGETHTVRNDWIEVSRTEAKQATTLAVCENAETAKSASQFESSAIKATHASMRAIMNRTCVEIAPGTSRSGCHPSAAGGGCAANPFTTPDKLFISRHPQDMRAGMQRLASVVVTDFGEDLQNGALYCFVSRDCEKMKMLRFDVNGWCLYYCRLAEGAFCWEHRPDYADPKLSL